MRFLEKRTATPYVYVVYGSQSAEDPEPVIAVTDAEADALSMEYEVKQKHPNAAVRWETLPVEGECSDINSVHVLFTLAGDTPDADPIGVKAFCISDDAKAALQKIDAPLPHEVRTYELGWRTSRWPFS